MAQSENKASYYAQGSTELAHETPVTVQRLEARRKLTKNSTRLVLVLVGLPARGKSFVARKLLHYLNWSGSECKIFNVGQYRRAANAEMRAMEAASSEEAPSNREQMGACDANFFDAHNERAAALREKVAAMAMEDMLRWLDDEEWEDDFALSRHSSVSLNTLSPSLKYAKHERVAIFDATNSTDKRRRWLLEMCTSPERRPNKPTGVVFVESICDDVELLEENFRYKISSSPDFENMSVQEAMEDLKARVHKYEEQYETITDDTMSYIKIYNLSTKLMVNHIYGRMAKELVPALMAWHIGTRPVFLCRPGETMSGVVTDGEDYVNRRSIDQSNPAFLDMSFRTRRKAMRGDSLGSNGRQFQSELLDFCYDEVHQFLFKRASVHDARYTGTSISGLGKEISMYSASNAGTSDTKDPFPMRILTSTMPRAVDTVTWDEFEFPIQQMSNLNPQDKGDFAGMELDEIRRSYPSWFSAFEEDPYGTRYPGGECYRDLIRRLTSVVIDVEQQVIPTLIVSHVSILQCLMAYFRNTPVHQCMSIEVPMHTVIKYTPVRGGGWKESVHPLMDDGAGVPAVASASEFSQLSLEGDLNSSSPIWDPVQLKRLSSVKSGLP